MRQFPHRIADPDARRHRSPARLRGHGRRAERIGIVAVGTAAGDHPLRISRRVSPLSEISHAWQSLRRDAEIVRSSSFSQRVAASAALRGCQENPISNPSTSIGVANRRSP